MSFPPSRSALPPTPGPTSPPSPASRSAPPRTAWSGTSTPGSFGKYRSMALSCPLAKPELPVLSDKILEYCRTEWSDEAHRMEPWQGDVEWDEGNESELARHHITPTEVHQVLDSEPIWARNRAGRAGTHHCGWPYLRRSDAHDRGTAQRRRGSAASHNWLGLKPR
jgi:hypothetical protein